MFPFNLRVQLTNGKRIKVNEQNQVPR